MGVKVGNDAAPDFHAQTLRAGTSPPDRTFYPNPLSTIPGQSYPNSNRGTWQNAQSTIGGATSQDVYKGMGKPCIGQTTGDLRHQTSQRCGVESQGKSMGDAIKSRGLERDQWKGGKTSGDMPFDERVTMIGAEERDSNCARPEDIAKNRRG